MPRLPRFQYQATTQALSTEGEAITESRWHQPWSEPRDKRKPGTHASRQPFFMFSPDPIVSFGWFEELSKPSTLAKKGLRSPLQQFFAYSPNQTTITPFAWFGNLSDPVRIRRGLRASLQRPFTADTDVIPVSKLIQWFGWLSDPVRKKRGLRASLQHYYEGPSRLLPNPNITGTMNAIETKDTFFAAGSPFNRPISGELGVQELDRTPGELSISNQPAPISARMSISTR